MTHWTPEERAIIDDIFGNPTDEAEMLAAMATGMEAESKAAAALMEADPRLPYISALIIARDRARAELARTAMERGVTYQHAVTFVGSYARVDFAVRAIEAGHVAREAVLADLPDLWSGSDPDDTDPRFLALWQDAWVANGMRYVRQPGGRALPIGRTLRAYRGQDEDAPLGIAWSLDLATAEKFARGAATRQPNRGGTVFVTHVPRKRVLGYMTERGESEVIFDPSGLVVSSLGPHVRTAAPRVVKP